MSEKDKLNGSSSSKSSWTPATIKSKKILRGGFGFVQAEGVERDVFLHSSVAVNCHVELPLGEGCRVLVRYDYKGPEGKPRVRSIKLSPPIR